ncbi:hypothetical protein HJFPF1_06015 [Paramyrothecium foliicola]|nr:hypothetical protein HJFPF1_06015 [Paramyrothecium foliicola]
MFINTTFYDIELHRLLSSRSSELQQNTVPANPKLYRQPKPPVKHLGLMQYFHSNAYLALVTFTPPSPRFRDTLMQMALFDTSSAQALLNALLAFSSLRRNGRHREAIAFKLAATQALAASANRAAMNWVEAAQHVAACMLLCAFEIEQTTESSGKWLCYTHGAMSIVEKSQLNHYWKQHSIRSLLDWVFYHETLSRFTISNWGQKPIHNGNQALIERSQGGSQMSTFSKATIALRPLAPDHAILELLSEVCEVIIDPVDPRSHEEGYKKRLKSLEWNIKNIPFSRYAAPDKNENRLKSSALSTNAELYQTATLIYLKRASQNPMEPPADLDHIIQRGFAIPAQAPSCGHFFPLFILACEARTEEQRASILCLIDRSERLPTTLRIPIFPSSIFGSEQVFPMGMRNLPKPRTIIGVLVVIDHPATYLLDSRGELSTYVYKEGQPYRVLVMPKAIVGLTYHGTEEVFPYASLQQPDVIFDMEGPGPYSIFGRKPPRTASLRRAAVMQALIRYEDEYQDGFGVEPTMAPAIWRAFGEDLLGRLQKMVAIFSNESRHGESLAEVADKLDRFINGTDPEFQVDPATTLPPPHVVENPGVIDLD